MNAAAVIFDVVLCLILVGGRLVGIMSAGAGTIIMLQVFEVEALASFCIVCHDMTIAEKLVLISDQSFESDRSASVELAGANADFGSETVTVTVCEAGRTIHVTAGRIN